MNSPIQNIHRLFTESSCQRGPPENKEVILKIIFNKYI